MKKQYLLPLFILFLTAILCLSAQAGSNPLLVSTYGRGAEVYTASSGSKQAGILYNGFSAELSLSSTNGLYSLYLTPDCTVWVNQKKAQEKKDEAASSAWLAEVIQQEAPLYSSPQKTTLNAMHAVGTRVIVWGEFGDFYYVRDNAWVIEGFFPKSCLQKITDFSDSETKERFFNSENLEEARIFTDGNPIYPAASALGFSDFPINYSFKHGETVHILSHMGDWAQLLEGGFIESRFLDPNGDHSRNYARVKSDQILDRLNLRGHASSDAWVNAKLCAGTRVEILSHNNEWAFIHVTGEHGGADYSGCVKLEFLSLDDQETALDGSTRIRLTKPLNAGNGGTEYRLGWSGEALPAGTYLTVIGVEGNYDASMDYPDRLLALTEEGKLICIWNDDVLFVVESAGISAKTDSSLKMRQAPHKEAEVLRTLSKGTKVEVLLRGEGWTMIRYKDQTGYVMSRYLIFP